jgi:hypothetical protein
LEGVEPCDAFPWLQHSNHLNKTKTCSKTNLSLTRVVSPSASIMEHDSRLRIKSTVQDVPCTAGSYSSSQETPCVWNPNVRYPLQ